MGINDPEVQLTEHGLLRARQRGITMEQIKVALETAKKARNVILNPVSMVRCKLIIKDLTELLLSLNL